MSRELEELRRIAREERLRAWTCTKLLPAHAGDVASEFAKRHPLVTMGSAAALTATLLSRSRRRHGLESKSNSIPMAAAAFGVQLLPDVLRLAGLTVPREKAGSTVGRSQPLDRPRDGRDSSAPSGQGTT